MRCRLPPPEVSIRGKYLCAHQIIHEFAGLGGPFLPAPLNLRAAVVVRCLAGGGRGADWPMHPDGGRRLCSGFVANAMVAEGASDRFGGNCGSDLDAAGGGDRACVTGCSDSGALTARLWLWLMATVFFEREGSALAGGRAWVISYDDDIGLPLPRPPSSHGF